VLEDDVGEVLTGGVDVGSSIGVVPPHADRPSATAAVAAATEMLSARRIVVLPERPARDLVPVSANLTGGASLR
jgi:hypothetical protein